MLFVLALWVWWLLWIRSSKRWALVARKAEQDEWGVAGCKSRFDSFEIDECRGRHVWERLGFLCLALPGVWRATCLLQLFGFAPFPSIYGTLEL